MHIVFFDIFQENNKNGLNNFEVVQNLNTIFNEVDFILLSQQAFLTELFNCDLCLIQYVVTGEQDLLKNKRARQKCNLQ